MALCNGGMKSSASESDAPAATTSNSYTEPSVVNPSSTTWAKCGVPSETLSKYSRIIFKSPLNRSSAT